MLRYIFTLSLLLLFMGCTPKSTIVLSETLPKEPISTSTIQKIPIPVRDIGYKQLKSKLFTTQKEFDNLLKKIELQKNWKHKKNFIDSLTLLPIDFTNYNLLLYRLSKKSDATVLAVDAPKGTKKHIIIEIGEDNIETNTTKTAYYALAYKVAKSVKEITFNNGSKKEIIQNIDSNYNKKQEVPEECLEWYDGCNNCGKVGPDNDIVCTERYCIHHDKFKCTKWKSKKNE